MSAPAGTSGLSSSGLQDSTQLQRGQTAKLAAHSHVAALRRRCLTPGVRPSRGGGNMCLRGVTTRAAAAGIGPGIARPAWSVSSNIALPDTELNASKPRASVIAEAYRRRSSRSRATKNDNSSSTSSGGSKGFGSSSSTSGAKKNGNSKRSKGRSTSSSEPARGTDDTTMQQQDTEQQDKAQPSSSSGEEAAAAAAAADPTPSDILKTAGHVEIPPGPAALSTAEHTIEAAAAAAEASDAAVATGGPSAGVVTSSRDVDSPGPDSPPWSPDVPDGPDNTQPDPPDQPISGVMGRDRSDEPTTAGVTPAELDSLQHLQPGHQDSDHLAAATAANDDDAAAARVGSSAPDAAPTAAAVAADPQQSRAQAASALSKHVSSQTGNFRDITGMDSKQYLQTLNEPHFPSLEVSERVRKSDPAPNSSSSSSYNDSSSSTNGGQHDAIATADSSSRWQQQQPDGGGGGGGGETREDVAESERLMSATAGSDAAGPVSSPAPAAGGLTDHEIRLGPDGIDQARYQALEAAAGETATAAGIDPEPSSSSSSSSSSNRRRRKGSKDATGTSSISNGQSDGAGAGEGRPLPQQQQQQQEEGSTSDSTLADSPATADDLSESERMMSASDGAAASGPQGPAPAAGGLTDHEIRLGPEGIDQARYQALEAAAGEIDPAAGGSEYKQDSSSSGAAPLEDSLSPDAASPGTVALEGSNMSASDAVKTTLSGTNASSSSTTADQLGVLGGDVGGSAAAASGGNAGVADSSAEGPQPAAAVAGTAATKSGSSSLEGAAAESVATAAVESGSSERTDGSQPLEQQQQQGASSNDKNSVADSPATLDDLSESERMMSASDGAAASGPQGPAPAAGGLTDHEIRLGPEGIDQARYQALEEAAGETDPTAGAFEYKQDSSSSSGAAPLKDSLSPDAASPGAVALEGSNMSASEAVKTTLSGTDASSSSTTADQLGAVGGDVAGSAAAAAGGDADVADSSAEGPQPAAAVAETAAAKSGSSSLEGAAAESAATAAVEDGSSEGTDDKQPPEQQQQQQRQQQMGNSNDDDSLTDSPATADDLSESERMMSASGDAAASGRQGPAPAAGGLTDHEIRLGPDGIDQARYQALEEEAGEIDSFAVGSDIKQGSSSSGGAAPPEAAMGPDAASPGAVALEGSNMSASDAVKTTLSGTDAPSSSTTADQLGVLGGDTGGSAASAAAASGGDADVADSSAEGPQPAAAVAGTAATKSGSNSLEGAAAESAATAAVESGSSERTDGSQPHEQQQQASSNDGYSAADPPATADDLFESERMMSASNGPAASNWQGPAPAAGGLTDHEIRLGPDGIDQALEAAAGETDLADDDSDTKQGSSSNSGAAPLEAAMGPDAPTPGAVALEGSDMSASEAVKATSSGTDASSSSTTADQLGAVGGDVGGSAAAGSGGNADADVADSSAGGAQPAAAVAGAAAAKNGSRGLEGAAAESAAIAAVESGSSERTDGSHPPEQQQQQRVSSNDDSLANAPATADEFSESERMMSASEGAAASDSQVPAPAAGGLTDHEIRLGPEGIDQARYQALEAAAGETAGPSSSGSGGSSVEDEIGQEAHKSSVPAAAADDDVAAARSGEITGMSGNGQPRETQAATDPDLQQRQQHSSVSEQQPEQQESTPGSAPAAANDVSESEQLVSAAASSADAGPVSSPAPAAGGLTDHEIRLGPDGIDQARYQALEAAAGETADAPSSSNSSVEGDLDQEAHRSGIPGAAAADVAAARLDTGLSGQEHPPEAQEAMSAEDQSMLLHQQQQQQQQQADTIADSPATLDDLSESERMMAASDGAAASGPQGPAPAAGGLTDHEIRRGPDGMDQARYQALEEAAGEVAVATGRSSSRRVSLSSIDYSDLDGDSTQDLAEDLAAQGFTSVRRSKDRRSPAASGEYQPDYQAFGGQMPKQYSPDQAAAATPASGVQPDTEASAYQPDYQAFGGQVPDLLESSQATAAGSSRPDPEASAYQPEYQAFGGQVPDLLESSQATAAGSSRPDPEASAYEPDYQAFGGQDPDQYRSSQATAADSSRPDSQASRDQASPGKDTDGGAAHTNLAADASARAKESLHKAVQKVKTGGSSIRSVDLDTTAKAPAAAGQDKSAGAAKGPSVRPSKGPSVRPSSPESSGHYGSFAAQRLATAAENLSKNGYTAARKSPEAGDTSSTSSRDSSSESSHDAAATPAQSTLAAAQGPASASADTAQRLGHPSTDVAQQPPSASSAAAQKESAAAADNKASGLRLGSDKGVGVVQRSAGLLEHWVTQAAKAVWKLLQGLSSVLRVSGMYLLTGATRAAAAVIRILRTATDKLILQPSTAAAHMLGSTLHLTAKHTKEQLPAVKAAAADTANATATGVTAAGSALGSTAAAAGSAVAAAAGAAAQTVGSAAARLVGSNASSDSSSSSSITAGKLLRIETDAAEGKTMNMAFDTPAAATSGSSSSSTGQQRKVRDSSQDLSADAATTSLAGPEVGVSIPGPHKDLQAVAAEEANSPGLAQAHADDAAVKGVERSGEKGQQAVGSVLGGPNSSSRSSSTASGNGGGNVADGARSNGVQPSSAAPQQKKGLLGRARSGILRDLGRMARKPGTSSSSTADRYAAISILGSSWEEPDPISYSIDEADGPAAAATVEPGKTDTSAGAAPCSSVSGAAAAAPTARDDSTSSRANTTAAADAAPAPSVTSSSSSSTTGSSEGSTAAADPKQGQDLSTDPAVEAVDDEVMQLLSQLHDLLQTHSQLKGKIRADTSALNNLVQQLSALEAAADDSSAGVSDSNQSADAQRNQQQQQQQQLINQIITLDSSMADSLQQLKDLEAAAANIQDELATAGTAAEEADADAADDEEGDTTGIPQLYGAAVGYSRSSGGGSSSGGSGAAAGSGGSSRSLGQKSPAAGVRKGGSQVPGAGKTGKMQLPVGTGSLSRHEQQLLMQLYASGGGGGSGGQGGKGGGRGPGGAGDHEHHSDHDGHRRRGFVYWVKAMLSHLGQMPVRDALQLALQVWLGVVVLSGVAWYAYQLLYKVPVLEVKNMATTAVHAAETGADIAHGAVHTASTVAHAVGSAAGVETSLPSPDEIIHTGHRKGLGYKIKRLHKKLKPSGKHLGQGLKGLGSAGHSAVSAVVSPIKTLVAGSKGSTDSPDKQAVTAAATRLGAGLLLLAAAGAWGAEHSGKGGGKGRGFHSSRGARGFTGSRKRHAGSGESNAAVGLVRSVVGAALAVPAAVVGRGKHSSSSSGKKSGRSASRLKDRAKSVVMNFDDGTLYGDQLVIPGDHVLAGGSGKKATAAAGGVGPRGLRSGRSALLSNPSAAGGSGAGDSHEYVQLYRTLMERQSSWR